MGNYDIYLKIEEIKKRIAARDYRKAQKIVDTINLKKVKDISDLELIIKVFSENGRYQEAYKLLFEIYNKTNSRRILYDMVGVSIKADNIEQAQIHLEEYESLAPNDYHCYIFRYMIYKKQDKPIEILIKILEELKQQHYMERWAYELAKLYYKAGMEKECIEECSDLILWFGEGKNVEKAKILRDYYSGKRDKNKLLQELKKKAHLQKAGTEEELETKEESKI